MANSPSPSPLHLAASLIRDKRFRAAMDILVPYIKANPDSDDAWLLLSFTVQDSQKKRECILRALQINPENTRAQTRLAKLQTSRPEPATKVVVQERPEVAVELDMPKRKDSHRWVTFSISIVLLVLLVLTGYFGLPILLGALKTDSPTERAFQSTSPRESTGKPSPSQTQPPTSTPTITPTYTPTPTSSPTEIPPTPTLKFPNPDGELAQQMDDIQNQVSTIRELGILTTNRLYIIPQAEVHGLLGDLLMERVTREQVEDEARVLSAIGLINPSYDLNEIILAELGEGLGGFYIPWRDELFVTGSEFSGVSKFIYAHEYDHALVDQHYHLDQIVEFPECIQNNDRCLAITALIEGDATYLMYQWLNAYANEADIADIESSDFSPIDHIISGHQNPPPYVLREISFKYFEGQFFIEHLLENGGWSNIDAVYQNLPLSTEHILHPEKFLSKEGPIQIDLPPLENLLGEDWRHVKTDTFGELTTQMILSSSENYLLQLDPITAANAASGWGGDKYQVYYRSKSNHTILVAQWQWDTPEDGGEFWRAMSEYVNRRYFGQEVQDTREDCWTRINDHVTCIFRTSKNTLWLIAPDMEFIKLLLADYPEFY